MPRLRRLSSTYSSDESYDWDDRSRPVRRHRRPRAADHNFVYAPRSYSIGRRREREPHYTIINNDRASLPGRDSPPRRARSMSRARPGDIHMESLEYRLNEKNLDRLASALAVPRAHKSRRSSSSSRDESEYRRQLRKLKQREQDYEEQLRNLKLGKKREEELDERLEELARNKQRQKDYEDQLDDLKREKDRLRRHESENEHGKRREDVRREIENELKLEELRDLHEKEAKKKYLEDALLAEKISALEKEREDKLYEKKIREKIENEKIKAELEELERVQRENKLKDEAIEEHIREEKEKELQRREEKEKADKDFEDRVKQLFGKAGYSSDAALALLDRQHEKPLQKAIGEREKEALPWVKVHRRWICPETLAAFQIPWEYSDDDADYILINRWIDEGLQEQLFAHTRDVRNARQQKQIAAPPSPDPAPAPALLEMKVNDRDRDNLYLVKKKKNRSPLAFFR